MDKQQYYIVSRIAKGLAWSHFLLINIRIAAGVVAGILSYAGRLYSESSMPSEGRGGKGFNTAQAHEILAPFVDLVSLAILTLLIGVISGGIGFLFKNYHK